MLELVIAIVVALVVGLLIGLTAAVDKVTNLEALLSDERRMLDKFVDEACTDVAWQINMLHCTVDLEKETLTNTQRKRLRRLGSKLLRIKDKDEDHPDSVEGQ